ncbi:hypothetical protein [Hymenobacter cellulosilyticus]|uniref:Uncharacterized protein n=1 Tax=Hymenobacter cellulosilyticus TaxID=2932248 RepID=A0A8T9Q2E2_9BACT|nr:hypothetical protein [Hymenobacter cellulosilyticus]UOQ71607.1 hypothetical protein MUN79_23805 [Hymenobacter cellulosilyticus]
MAARIEGANKEFGTYFLVSQAVVDAAGPDLAVTRSIRTPLKGKKGEHCLYEVALMPTQAEQ